MKGKTERGFSKHGTFRTTWHGEVRVQESSVACKGACVWVFCELAYSNEPKKSPPQVFMTPESVDFSFFPVSSLMQNS